MCIRTPDRRQNALSQGAFAESLDATADRQTGPSNRFPAAPDVQCAHPVLPMIRDATIPADAASA